MEAVDHLRVRMAAVRVEAIETSLCPGRDVPTVAVLPAAPRNSRSVHAAKKAMAHVGSKRPPTTSTLVAPRAGDANPVSMTGAGGGTRTHTVSIPRDFKSLASTSSATSAAFVS